LLEQVNRFLCSLQRRKDGRVNIQYLEHYKFLELVLLTPHVTDQSRISISERIYSLENNISEVPKCIECGEPVNYINRKYSIFCSRKCLANSKTLQENTKLSNIKKWNISEGNDFDLGFNLPRLSDRRVFSGALTEEMIKKIFEKTNFVKDLTIKSLQQRFFCLENNIFEIPRCSECDELVKWNSGRRNYNEFCSSRCSQNSTFVKNKKIDAFLKNFGCSHPNKTKAIQDKISISHTKHYQMRRNIEGTDYSGVVYILYFPKLVAVKIGLSGDFVTRSKALKTDFGDFEIIQLIETQTCFALESELHKKYSEFRFCLEEGEGRTEFFREEILEALKEKND